MTLVPALKPAVAAFAGWFDGAVEALVAGRSERGARRRDVRAAIGHALTFETWRSLVRQQRLPRAQAVDLMAKLVAAAASEG